MRKFPDNDESNEIVKFPSSDELNKIVEKCVANHLKQKEEKEFKNSLYEGSSEPTEVGDESTLFKNHRFYRIGSQEFFSIPRTVYSSTEENDDKYSAG